MDKEREAKRDQTIIILVELVTLLLGEHPKFDLARSHLFDAAVASGHVNPDMLRPI